jgi:hypothetical protein
MPGIIHDSSSAMAGHEDDIHGAEDQPEQDA